MGQCGGDGEEGDEIEGRDELGETIDVEIHGLKWRGRNQSWCRCYVVLLLSSFFFCFGFAC